MQFVPVFFCIYQKISIFVSGSSVRPKRVVHAGIFWLPFISVFIVIFELYLMLKGVSGTPLFFVINI